MLKLLNSLTQTTKLKRSKIPDASLYIEQRNSGYSILLKFKSPTTFKQQYIKLNRFTYKQVVTADDIANIHTRTAILLSDIARGIDLLEVKQEAKHRFIL